MSAVDFAGRETLPEDDELDPDVCPACHRGEHRACEGNEERECVCGSHVHERNVAEQYAGSAEEDTCPF